MISEWESEQEQTLLEECIDELDATVARLERFPAVVLAFGMRAHLAALLHALKVSGQIGDQELHEFLSRLRVEALDPGEEDP